MSVIPDQDRNRGTKLCAHFLCKTQFCPFLREWSICRSIEKIVLLTKSLFVNSTFADYIERNIRKNLDLLFLDVGYILLLERNNTFTFFPR